MVATHSLCGRVRQIVHRSMRQALVVAVFLAYIVASNAYAFGDDNLQSRDPHYLATLCSAQYGDDDVKAAKVVGACKALERLTHESEGVVAPLMQAKADGKRLSYSDFGKVIEFVSANRLATSVVAVAYYKHGELHFGRQYAAQAIGWGMYDAKDAHDLIATLHQQLQGQAYDKERAILKTQLDQDKAIAPLMEQLYPGVTAEALGKINMKKVDYDKLMRAL